MDGIHTDKEEVHLLTPVSPAIGDVLLLFFRWLYSEQLFLL